MIAVVRGNRVKHLEPARPAPARWETRTATGTLKAPKPSTKTGHGLVPLASAGGARFGRPASRRVSRSRRAFPFKPRHDPVLPVAHVRQKLVDRVRDAARLRPGGFPVEAGEHLSRLCMGGLAREGAPSEPLRCSAVCIHDSTSLFPREDAQTALPKPSGGGPDSPTRPVASPASLDPIIQFRFFRTARAGQRRRRLRPAATSEPHVSSADWAALSWADGTAVGNARPPRSARRPVIAPSPAV